MRVKIFLYDIGSWRRPSPHSPFASALGGRESAQIRMTQELAKLGWDVDLYCPNALQDEPPVTVDGVTWHHPATLLSQGPTVDAVLVSCESPALFQKVRGTLNILQVQCAHPMPHDPIGKKNDPLIDFYFGISHFQRFSMRERDAFINADHFVVFGNGIDLERFDSIDVPRVPYRMVYSSSPDRGLHHIIRIWPDLKERFPDATLHVLYNIDAMQEYRWMHELRAEWCHVIDQGRHLSGVTYVGPVSQASVAAEIKQASLYAYPCDPIWEAETFCVTATECLAARTPLVLTDVDCLGEWYNGKAHFLPVPIKDHEWLNGLSYLFTHPEERDQFVAAGRAFAEDQTWSRVAKRWDAFLRARLAMTNPSLDDILALISATEDRRLVTV